jgi:hypothetical protein
VAQGTDESTALAHARGQCGRLQVSCQHYQKWRLFIYFNKFEVVNSNRFFSFRNQVSNKDYQKWTFF